MSCTPEISVALPVHNGANYLRAALDSVLAQEWGDFELVVSENASTDETPDILREYSRQDRRIRVSRTDTLIDVASNINRAVDLASGAWVKLVCHDDLLKPNCLTRMREVLSSLATPSVGLVCNAEEWLFSNGVRYRIETEYTAPARLEGRDFLRNLLTGTARAPLPSVTTAMVRKEAWDDAGRFDPRFAHCDIFLWSRLLTRWDYVFVPEILTVNRIHGMQVAVSARKGLRSAHDHDVFWAEFLDEFGSQLDLPLSTAFKVRLRGLSSAGGYIGIELLKHNLRGALDLVRASPVTWWPLLPFVAVRALLAEKRRIAPLVDRVPVSLIYPG